MKKQFIHKSEEVCKLCQKQINTKIEDWVSLIDYSGKKQTAIGFYHRKCLTDLFQGKGEVIRKKFEDKLGMFVKKMFGSAGIDNTQFGINLKNLAT